MPPRAEDLRSADYSAALMLELPDQFGSGQDLSVENAIRRAEDPSARLVHVPGHALIDHPPIRYPVISENRGGDQKDAYDRREQREA